MFGLVVFADVYYGKKTMVPALALVFVLTYCVDKLRVPSYAHWFFFPAIAVWKRSYEIIDASRGDHDFIVWESGLLTDEAVGRLHVIYRAARSLAMVSISKLGIVLVAVDYVRYMQYGIS